MVIEIMKIKAAYKKCKSAKQIFAVVLSIHFLFGINQTLAAVDCNDTEFWGGHFDLSLFQNTNRIYNKHEYDDVYDITELDLVQSAEIDNQWITLLSGQSQVKISFMNTRYGSGTYTLTSDERSYTGDTRADTLGTIIIDPDSVTSLLLDFRSPFDLRPTDNGTVRDDSVMRDTAFSVNIHDMSDNLIYQLAIFEHISEPHPADFNTNDNGIPDECEDVPTVNPVLSGVKEVGQTLSITLNYFDTEGDAPGTHTYQWYRADDVNGTNETAISGKSSSTYTTEAEIWAISLSPL